MGYRNILITLDGSELAECVIKPALRLAEPGAKIHLLSVIEETTSIDVPLPSHVNATFPLEHIPPVIKSDMERAIASRTDYLLTVTANLRGFEVTTEVRSEGAVEDAILNAAPKYDLLAMATHGRSGLSKFLLGSVTEAVLHKAPCPLFVAPARALQHSYMEPSAGYDCILVSLDGTSESELILPEVEKLLSTHPCRVILLKVAPYITLTEEHLSHDEYLLLNDAAEREAREYLDRIGKSLKRFGAKPISEVSFDAPDDAIRLFAQSHHADLIAMATHGRTGVNRLLHGSVTEDVMHHTLCPMLIVREFAILMSFEDRP